MTEQEYQAMVEEQKRNHEANMLAAQRLGQEYANQPGAQQSPTPAPAPSEAPEDMGLGRKDMEAKRLQYLKKMMGR